MILSVQITAATLKTHRQSSQSITFFNYGINFINTFGPEQKMQDLN